MEELIPQITDYGVKIGGALVGLWLSFKVAGLARSAVVKALTKSKFDETLTAFFGSMARYLVLIAAVLALLSIFGIETTSFAAVLGAAGLAVGLAFQGSLSNFSAGVMILTFRPFKLGDFISAAGVVGTVREIGLFTVALDSPQNHRLIVPNGALFGATIDNMSHHPNRRVDVPVGTDYSADTDTVRAVLEKAAAAVPGQKAEFPPDVFLAGLGGSSVDWEVRVYGHSDDYWDLWQATIRSVKMHLDEAGIGIPYPQMDVHLDKVE